MFFGLFLILDREPNRAHVGEDHDWLIIPYVVPYYCSWEQVEERLLELWEPIENFWKHHTNIMRTFWECDGNTLETSKSKKFKIV
jgi:hypothetical protein